jgi:hypothetical protein
MTLLVDERGRRIATFRWIAVRLMETVAGWTPTTPEMEVKQVFGRHIWDFAQHADALGKRTFELRLPEQHSIPPTEPYHNVLTQVAALRGTVERLAGLYDAVLPGLEARYQRYLQLTDAVLDEPSIVIVERILTDLARQRRDADRVRRSLTIAPGDPGELRMTEAAIADVCQVTATAV